MNHSTFLLRLIYVNFFFELESCNDGRKNQNETGIDCGGPCNDCGKLECALTLIGFLLKLEYISFKSALLFFCFQTRIM